MVGELTDPLEGNAAGPTAVFKPRNLQPEHDPEEDAAAATEDSGAVGASVTLLLAVLALDCWRAVQQSVTHDEALAVARSFADDPHAVHALLARLSTSALGASEWALRLPSLLGALIFLLSALGLCRLAFGRGWLGFLGFALLAANPLLLDLQSFGRGDGLALGLWTWGALMLLRFAQGTTAGAESTLGPIRAIAGSLLLGLAAASCPTVAPAALSLLAVAVAALLAQRRSLPGGATSGRRVSLALAGLLFAGPPLAALLLWLPLGAGAGLQAVFAGNPDAHAAVLSIADASLAHQPDARPLAPDGPFYPLVRAGLLLGFGPLLAVAVVWRLARVLRRWSEATSLAELEPFERFHALVGVGLLLTALIATVAHFALGLPWPDARSGAPLLVLALLGATGLAVEGWTRGGALRATAALPLLVLIALMVQFGSQAQVAEYRLWRQDSSSRASFEQIVRQQDKHPRVSVRVAAAEELQPALDFYRVTRHAGWMQPVERGYDLAQPADFLLVPASDARRAALAGFAQVATDPAAGVAVLERSSE